MGLADGWWLLVMVVGCVLIDGWWLVVDGVPMVGWLAMFCCGRCFGRRCCGCHVCPLSCVPNIFVRVLPLGCVCGPRWGSLIICRKASTVVVVVTATTTTTTPATTTTTKMITYFTCTAELLWRRMILPLIRRRRRRVVLQQ